jgi:hypothetical protein
LIETANQGLGTIGAARLGVLSKFLYGLSGMQRSVREHGVLFALRVCVSENVSDRVKVARANTRA